MLEDYLILIGILQVSYLQMCCTKFLFHATVKTFVEISRLYQESSGFLAKAVVGQKGVMNLCEPLRRGEKRQQGLTN